MKNLVFAGICLFSFASFAEQVCDSGLAAHVGTYNLSSSQGDHCPYGQTLTVSITEYGYQLGSSGGFVGPGRETTSTDKCVVTGSNMTYQTCAYNQQCRPQWWVYDFTSTGVTFSANGCVGKFTKVQ
jgi:hypothetical protein